MLKVELIILGTALDYEGWSKFIGINAFLAILFFKK
jgi:hypothetical protein